METVTVRPLLTWVGGKRQLLPHLRRFYPATFNRYLEPFLGSGAVFFDLYRAGRLRDRDVVLIDSNLVDPPYAPVSRTANFTGYTSSPFDTRHQRRLQQLVVSLARPGSHVLSGNSTAGEIVGLYDRNDRARRAGLRAHRVESRRAVNSNPARRGFVDEFLITDVEPLAQSS